MQYCHLIKNIPYETAELGISEFHWFGRVGTDYIGVNEAKCQLPIIVTIFSANGTILV